MLFSKLTLIGCSLFLINCNNNKSTNSTEIDSSTRMNNTIDMPDSKRIDTVGKTPIALNEFVSKAVAGGMAEVELGKIAQINGNSQAVKDYGKMLETDHSDANTKLTEIATAENILIPANMTNEHLMHINDLKAKTGQDFDKSFMTMMVDDHTKDIAEFKKAATGNHNQKIKEFAAKTLPTLQAHLKKAKKIKNNMK